MKQSIFLVAAAILLVTFKAFANDESKAEQARLEGTWIIVGKEYLGKKASEADLKKLTGKTVIKGDKITEWIDDLGKEEVISEATFTLDFAAKPKPWTRSSSAAQ